MIVAAAIKTKDGKVHVAARHRLCCAVVARSIGLDWVMSGAWSLADGAAWSEYKRDWRQGFVTDHGEFLSREAALAHVEACRQWLSPRRAEHPGAVLTSEDLW